MQFQRLEDLRVDHDMSMTAVAEHLQMHPGVYSRYEHGQREIPVWALIKLSALYNVSVDYILGLTDDPRRHA